MRSLRFPAPLVALLGAPFVLGSTPASRPQPVRYSISPRFAGEALSELAVEVRLRADPDGETVLELPDSYGGVKEHWRYLSPIEVAGATVATPSPDKRVLRSAPNAPLTIRYRVRTAYPSDPDG